MEEKINPSHYKAYSVETIDMMVAIWGREKVADYCEITAFKHSMRIGTKNGQELLTEVGKRDWCLQKAKQLRTKL